MNETELYRKEEFDDPKLSDGKRWVIFWLIIIGTHVPLVQLANAIGGFWLMLLVALIYGWFAPTYVGNFVFGYDAVYEKVKSWIE